VGLAFYPAAVVLDNLTSTTSLGSLQCVHRPYFHTLFSSTNQLHIYLNVRNPVRISFYTTPVLLANEIQVTMQTAVSGFLASPGYDGIHYRSNKHLDLSHTLVAPAGYIAIMISFEYLRVFEGECDFFSIALTPSDDNSTELQTTHLCRLKSALVFQARKLHVSQQGLREFYAITADLGFKMFSFHQQNATPHQEEGGKFNCSVSFYSSF
jgi:hypothetical protein